MFYKNKLRIKDKKINDDEAIIVDLNKVEASIKAFIFYVRLNDL